MLYVNGEQVYGIIYKIENVVNNKVYIGQTTRKRGFNNRYDKKGVGIERVYNCLLRDMKSKTNRHYNKHLFNSISKYGFDAFKITEIFDIAYTKEQLDNTEIAWIEIYDSFHNGYNNCEGGNGIAGIKGELNSKAKKVVQLNTKGEYIKTWNCITDAANDISTSPCNIICCCQGDTYIAKGFIWRYLDDYIKNPIVEPYKKGKNNKRIPVIQLDLQGNKIAEWRSSAEAGFYTEINYKDISACCNNKVKSAGGFMWIKKEDYENGKKLKPWTYDNYTRKIVQLDLKGHFIKQWDSMVSASVAINGNEISRANIMACCQYRQKSAYGYMWMYLEDYNINKDNIKPLDRKIDITPKKVIQLDKENNFIREWDTMSDADRGTGISFKNISACCRHKRNIAGGFKWVYANEYYMNILEKTN